MSAFAAAIGALEAWATARTEDSVRGLLDLAPDRAVVVARDGSERAIAAADLVAGNVIRVRPGDRIAADGTVVDGASEVDQATITGEPLPVDLKGRAIYYVGPVDPVAGEVVGPAGPTTATRMDKFTEQVLAHQP